METQIRVEETVARGGRFSFRDYLQDFQEGFQYLRREKGLLRVYTYMPLSNGLSSGTSNLVTAYFRSTPELDMTMYAFFRLNRRLIGFPAHKTVPELFFCNPQSILARVDFPAPLTPAMAMISPRLA